MSAPHRSACLCDDCHPRPADAASDAARPVLSDYDFENILISAVRYAVGRGTEHLLGTARIVAEQAPWLTGRARNVIARDITTELGYRDASRHPDEAAWEQALAALKAALLAGVETGDPA